MARFLSEPWIAELNAAGQRVTVSADLHLILQQIVVDETGPQIAYVIRIGEGSVTVTVGRDPAAEITLTQDRETAAAIAQAELSAQSAFMSGRLRVGGDLRGVLARAQELAVMSDVFEAARSSTTW